MIYPIFTTLRPKRWLENLIIFGPLIFEEKAILVSGKAWLCASVGFLALCGLSGSEYLLNDLVDLERDKRHPEKRYRPLPSGQVSVTEAKAALIMLLLLSLFAAWQLSFLCFTAALSYFMVNVIYSFKTKKIAILDIMTIGMGIIIKVFSGIAVLKAAGFNTEISGETVMFIFFASLMPPLIRIRRELLLSEETIIPKNCLPSHYTSEGTEKLIQASAILCFICYIIQASKVSGTISLIYTIPVAAYCIFRCIYLINKPESENTPIESLLTDKSIVTAMILWLISVICIIHF